jgi:hypothetical protein
VFDPLTIDRCFLHDGAGKTDGIKTPEGKWNITGHADRIVRVDEAQLRVFAQLYDESGTPALRARLPSIHAGTLSSVLRKLADYPRRLADLGEDYYSTQHWNEVNAQHDGTILRNNDRSAPFAATPQEWVLSGPHFFVANPFYKTPRPFCINPRAYDPLDLETLPEDYLPRTNYRPMADLKEYGRRTPTVSWVDPSCPSPRRVTEFYRIAVRKMLSQSSERTLSPALIIPKTAHIDGCFSVTFRGNVVLTEVLGAWMSLIADFLVKTTGKSNFRADMADFMFITPSCKGVTIRTLALNCLTSHYAPLWAEVFSTDFCDECWSQPVNPRLPQRFFRDLTPEWQRNGALRSDYARRMALVEIDVMVAQALGLSLDELQLIYRVQFPVIQQNERDTWYDLTGRIVFTCNIGLAGTGLPRKRGKKDAEITLTLPDGRTRPIQGWEELRQLQESGQLPDGSVATITVTDDTLPSGPRKVERRYTAPFALANREEDYKIAWAFFEAKAKKQTAS